MSDTSSQDKKQAAKPKDKKSPLAIGAFVLALLSLILFATNYMQMQELSAAANISMQQIAAEANSNLASQEQLQQLEQQVFRQNEQLKAFEQENKQNHMPSHHALMVAKSYTEMAKLRLALFNDTETCLQLLNWADHVLREASVSGAATALDNINKLIAEVGGIGFVDTTAVWQQLMELASLEMPWPQSIETSMPDTQITNLKGFFMDLVRVQSHESKPLKPVLDKAMQLQYEQSLQSLLYTAASALINNNQALYKDSLNIADSLLKQLFSKNPFAERFADLRNVKISVALPDFEPAIESIRAAGRLE